VTRVIRATCVLTITMLGACVQSDTRVCGSLTCAPGRVCGELRGEPLCLLPGQDAVCGPAVDGTPCAGSGFVGICDTAFCLPGCGDGLENAGEQCDDGNFVNRDGCSSSCLIEVLAWTEWQRPTFARVGHGAAYDAARSSLVVVGGYSNTNLADEWQRADMFRAWTQVATTPLGVRVRPAIAYDSSRGKVVLFGGADGTGDRGDTWEFDGTTWTELHPTVSPPARHGAAMVFDSARNKLVLFGGSFDYYDDTWELDGATSTWTQIPTSTKPLGRIDHVMAWDDARDRVVLFGGTHVAILGDTWEYNGAAGTWTAITPATVPPARFAAAMEYFPERGLVVLFGGKAYDAVVTTAGDTWELDGAMWRNVPTAIAPAARASATLTYDAALGRLVLVGGEDAAGQALEETWEYRSDGAWVSVPIGLYPQPRTDATMVYERSHDRLVLFGGIDASNNSFGDTWTFDGARWQAQRGSTAAARFAHGMAYDAATDGTVMFGGRFRFGAVYYDDTCRWDGANWTCTQLAGPSQREYGVLADAPGDGVLLFGGVDHVTSEAPKGDTWRFSAGAWSQVATMGGPMPDLAAAAGFDLLGDRTILLTSDGHTWGFDGGTWTSLSTDAQLARSTAKMTFDEWRGRMVLYGGTVDGHNTGDLWELVDDAWSPLTPPSGTQPTPRYGPAISVLPSARALVLFGGSSGDGIGHSDTWLLRYESETPDEACDNGIDDDGDLHIDADDPDCT
jgi:cysteine-rich repeat protein